jgi:DNA-binding transcriptional regulator YhcF (GntR family)
VGALDLHVNRDGEVPVGTQLAWQLQALITEGRLQPGEQLPSVRRLAEVAGVNVNTVRSVYERLEGEGFVVTQHGRGTFVAQNVPRLDPGSVAARVYGTPPPSRDELKDQISTLEAQLSAHEIAPPTGRRRASGPRILTTEELAEVRDELMDRLEQLDAMREDLVDILASLRIAMGDDELTNAARARTTSAADARRATRRRLSPAPRPSGSP